MIAEQAGKLIAKFIEKQWPSDKEDIFDILKLAANKAWQEGKWLGMTAEFFVPVMEERDGTKYIIAPSTHPILLAINGMSLGLAIRDEYFIFHRNGYGDIRDGQGCKWNTDVYDLGRSPVFDKNNIIPSGVKIGVMPIGAPGANEKININGTYEDGSQVFTYKYSGKQSCCLVDKNSIDTVNGIELEIKNGFNYIGNICFTNISSITKTITRTPIDVIAIDKNGNGYKIATLNPNQKHSIYRKYIVPNELCGKNVLHGLFKIGQQEDIVSMTDNIIIKNEEALISLAIGVHNMYYKQQIETGANFILQALSVLSKEKREESSPSEFPIQVDSVYMGDIPQSIQEV